MRRIHMEEIIETATPSETVETPITEQAVTTENAEPSIETVETKPERTFTQAELDDIIKRRVERAEESAAKRAAQEARDALIAEEGIEWNGKPIKTETEYRQMLKEQEIRKQYEGKVDEDILQEIVESKKFREEYLTKQQQDEIRTKQESDYQAFVAAYPDVQATDIPENVWAEVNAGKSLVDAYARHENQILKQKLAEVEKKQQIEQQNQENAASSTGSVTGQGDSKSTFFTEEQVKGMSQAEVNKNYDAIIASQKKWYK